jgi:hypothetical protein
LPFSFTGGGSNSPKRRLNAIRSASVSSCPRISSAECAYQARSIASKSAAERLATSTPAISAPTAGFTGRTEIFMAISLACHYSNASLRDQLRRRTLVAEPFGATGGARIGWLNASWPMARLSAKAGELSLKVSLIGSYVFTPGQVVALEPHGSIPLFGWGIRIVHTNPDYPERIVFSCLGSRDNVLHEIRMAGFRPQATPSERPARDGMAWRWSFLVATIAIWNLLIFVDGPWQRRPDSWGPTASASFLFLTTVALKLSPAVQAMALKPGRSFEEVRAVVNLLQMIGGVMLFAFLARPIANWVG